MTKYLCIIFILNAIATNAFSNKVVSISDSVNNFEIFYEAKKHNRTQIISIHVLSRMTRNEYDIKLEKPSIYKFNSYEFGEINLSLKDYDKDGINELLITNINQRTDNEGNQIIFVYNKANSRYHEIKMFRHLRSPQLQLGLNSIKEYDSWGDLKIERYYSIQNNTLNLDSTIVSKYTYNSNNIIILRKLYVGNTQTEYTLVNENDLSFNYGDTIGKTALRFVHKNFLFDLYFDDEKTLEYLIVYNKSKYELMRLRCKSVGIYLPINYVTYDSLAYLNNDYDLNNDGIMDFIFPSSQYGDLYLFLIDPNTSQLYINPRIMISKNTFNRTGNTLITRSSNPCGTLPRSFTKYFYSIINGEFSLAKKIDVVEYRKHRKIYSHEKTYVLEGINIKLLGTSNRKTNQKI